MDPHLMVVFVPTKLHVAISFLHPPSVKKVSVSCGVLSVRTGQLYCFIIFVLFFSCFPYVCSLTACICSFVFIAVVWFVRITNANAIKNQSGPLGRAEDVVILPFSFCRFAVIGVVQRCDWSK